MTYKAPVTRPEHFRAFFTMAPDEQIITQHTARPVGGASKALGVLAAVSAGGLMALRMKQAPLFFLAGAAAAALLSRKRVIPPARPMELMPQREPDPVPPKVVAAPPEVDAWLARQIEREQQTPVITLDVVEPLSMPEEVPAPEPQLTALGSLKLERNEQAEVSPFPSMPEFLNEKSEVSDKPRVQGASNWGVFLAEPPVQPAVRDFVSPSNDPGPGHVPELLIVDEPAAVSPSSEVPSNASWLLDIEPLPSLDELFADVHVDSADVSAGRSAFMALAPGIAPMIEAPDVPPMPVAGTQPLQPVYVPALFQGSALPDEITVGQVPSSVVDQVQESEQVSEESLQQEVPGLPESVMAEFFLPASASEEPLTLAVEALEVPVSLAQPGEASFDDPLAVLEENPSAVPGGMAPSPPLRPLAPAVEAEIVVRPRGLAATRVQAKSAAEASAEIGVVPAAESTGTLEDSLEVKSPPELPPAPVVLPREQKARKTWRSWWRGD